MTMEPTHSKGRTYNSEVSEDMTVIKSKLSSSTVPTTGLTWPAQTVPEDTSGLLDKLKAITPALTNESAAPNNDAEVENLEPGESKSSVDWAAIWSAMKWLGSCISDPTKHIKNIMLGDALCGTNAVTGIRRFGYIGSALNVVSGIGEAAASLLTGDASILGGSNTVADAIIKELNAVLDEFKNPSIEGIPIHADVEKQSQDITVAKNVYIRESARHKEQLLDNTVPQLKTWQISGYLMSNPHIMGNFGRLLIKPDLMAQRKLLQCYIDARMPVIFKTHDNRFYYVLITHFDSEYTIQGLNALKVNLTLTEFKTLIVDSEDSAVVTMKVGGANI